MRAIGKNIRSISVHNRMKRFLASHTLLLILAFLAVPGCTYNVNFSSPVIPALKPTVSGKGTVQISKIEDKRPVGTELFVYSNPPQKWIHHSDERVEDSVHKLLREGFARRGYSEQTDAKEGLQVSAEIIEFSGQNSVGALFIGKCQLKITCAVSISGPLGKKTLIVKGNGVNNIIYVTKENMQLLLSQAYEDFLRKLDQELAANGY